MSKQTYNLLLLYFLFNNFLSTLLLDFNDFNYKIIFVKKQVFNNKKNLYKYLLNNYFFFNNSWCIFYFSIIFLKKHLTSKKLFWFKPQYVKKINKKMLINI